MKLRLNTIWALLILVALLALNSCCKKRVYAAFLTIKLEKFSQNELNNLRFIGEYSSSEEMDIDFTGPSSSNQISIEFNDVMEFSQIRIVANDTTAIDTLSDVQIMSTNAKNRCSDNYDLKLSFIYHNESYPPATKRVLVIIK